MDAGVALALQQLEDFLLGEIFRDLHRKGNDQARVAGLSCAGLQVGVDRIGIVAAHRPGAAAAIKLRGAGEQQLQMVGQLRHRPDGGSRGADRIGLVDGDRRRNAVYAIDLRLVHAIQELAGVGRECLHVAPLALGVQRIEHQRGFAGAGNAGDHQQFVQRQVDVEVLEVVLARAANVDGFGMLVGHGRYIGK